VPGLEAHPDSAMPGYRNSIALPATLHVTCHLSDLESREANETSGATSIGQQRRYLSGGLCLALHR